MIIYGINPVLEALRAGRTVVFDRGRAYGDAAMIRLAVEDGQLTKREAPVPSGGWLAVLSRVCGIAGLLAVILFGFRTEGA